MSLLGARLVMAQTGKATLATAALAVLSLAPLLSIASRPLWAQYPGQVAKDVKDAPVLRSIAVLEWTGDAGKPKASRLVPVVVFDAGELQDGSVYLSRPAPMALTGGVEYELQENGKPLGLFDVQGAGQEQGSWVGHGAWKQLPVAKPKRNKPVQIDEEESDRPVLHRKHHADDSAADKGSSQSDSGSSAPAADPDRPTLHKKTTSDSSDTSATAGADTSSNAPSDPDRPVLHKKTSENSASASSNPDSSSSSDTGTPSDPDRPVLHKKTSDDAGTVSSDPDRPTLKKNKKKPEDVGHVESMADITDPDRPRLKRGKADEDALEVPPTLMGLPEEMEQTVAVSDAKSRPEHPWSFDWANPEDEGKMKAALEEIARGALGLNPPPPAPAPVRGRKKAQPTPPATPLEPAPLMDEQFRVFELAYGSGATLVLSARTDAAPAERKYVTLIAQPDLYGNLLVLLKNVSSAGHLDETPRLRLVDAVDALADNRGELLFELRGATQRQFALYRVLRGQAEQIFISNEAVYGAANRE